MDDFRDADPDRALCRPRPPEAIMPVLAAAPPGTLGLKPAL